VFDRAADALLRRAAEGSFDDGALRSEMERAAAEADYILAAYAGGL